MNGNQLDAVIEKTRWRLVLSARYALEGGVV
jgi:hypothetical protein